MSEMFCDDGGGLDAIRERTARRCVPFSAIWELTYRCNLKCRHCYVRASTCGDDLTTGECFDVLSQLAEAGFFFLLFSGGEPLVREDFFDILAEAKRLTFAVKIMTNGTLIDEAAAERIAGLTPVAVDISLYGRPETHDSITGVPGSHGSALAAVRALRERGVMTRMKSPIMRSNLADFEYLRELSTELGCAFIFDTTVVPADDGDRAPLEERLEPEQVEELFALASRGKPMEAGGNHVDGEPVCNAGRNTCRIKPDGQLTPCVAIRGSVGGLRERRLLALWGDIGFREVRSMRPEMLPECRACELRGYCVRCSGLAEVEDGDLYGRSTAACLVARVRRKMHERTPAQ